MSSTVTVAVLNDFEVVVKGVTALLVDQPGIDVLDWSVSDLVTDPVDVALYDTFGSGVPGAALSDVVADERIGALAVYTANFHDDLVRTALGAGAKGYLHKSLDGRGLAQAISRLACGECVVIGPAGREEETVRRWPGKLHDLTEREANVLALICLGLSNEEIAERLYISVNTVKTRIRKLFGKLKVDNRTQAALWGVKHGFEPDRAILTDES